MKILKTPWKKEFLDLVSQSKESIKITSPFVKENIIDEIISNKIKNTQLELITSFKLMNIYSGSVDLMGLEKIINGNGIVKNFPKLHSKIYLFDDRKVVITSGNLTNGGLINNYEYGIYSDDIEIVSQVKSDFSLLSSDKDIGNIKLSHISDVRKILANLPPMHYVKLPYFEINSPEDKNDVIDIEEDILASSLSGWKLEVLKCIQLIPSQIFSLQELNKFELDLKKIYPSNKHILEKIRQQLQYLRDLGLIEFLGNGLYKKLWK